MTDPRPIDWIVPWFPGALIQTLAADADFMVASQQRLSSRAQWDATKQFTTVQTITDPPISATAGAWRPTLQVVSWCPPGAADEDPALVAWRIAAAAVRAVLRRPKWAYDGWHGVWELVLGPVEDVDRSRGEDSPIYGARLHIESGAKVDPF